VQELDSDVCGVATRATVAHRKEPAVAAIDIRNSSGSSDDFLTVVRKKILDHFLMMSCLLSHGLEQSRIHRQGILLLAVKERVKSRQIWIFRQTH